MFTSLATPDPSTSYRLLCWVYAIGLLASLALYGVETLLDMWHGVWMVVRDPPPPPLPSSTACAFIT